MPLFETPLWFPLLPVLACSATLFLSLFCSVRPLTRAFFPLTLPILLFQGLDCGRPYSKRTCSSVLFPPLFFFDAKPSPPVFPRGKIGCDPLTLLPPIPPFPVLPRYARGPPDFFPSRALRAHVPPRLPSAQVFFFLRRSSVEGIASSPSLSSGNLFALEFVISVKYLLSLRLGLHLSNQDSSPATPNPCLWSPLDGSLEFFRDLEFFFSPTHHPPPHVGALTVSLFDGSFEAVRALTVSFLRRQFASPSFPKFW